MTSQRCARIASTFSEVSRSWKGTTVDVGVEGLDRALRGVDLRLAEVLRRVDDLALEVRVVDDVWVDDADRPDACRGEVEGGGRAEAARADQQHARVEQALLALFADLRDEEVARVARALRRRESGGRDDVIAVPLPADEAVLEVDCMLVAEVAQRLRRERGAGPARAVDDERLRLVGDQRLDARLEVVPRNVEGARQVPLVPFVARTDVDEDVRCAVGEQAIRLGGRDLVDLGPSLREQLPVGRHYFQEYSDRSRLP